MYGSASTWVFNVARQIVATADPEIPIRACFAGNLDALQQLADTPTVSVVKTHELDSQASDWLDARASHIFISIRDPRDCVASLMQYMRHPFGDAVRWVAYSAMQCAQFAHDPRALLLRYESRFTDDRGTLDVMASRLGMRLSGTARERVFAEFRRSAIEAKIHRISTLPTAQHDARSGDVFDTDSQWHLHHANRSGQVGRWRAFLSDEQVRVVEQSLDEWLRAFDYL